MSGQKIQNKQNAAWKAVTFGILLFATALGGRMSLSAQEGISTIGDTNIRPFRLGGSVTMLSQAYAVQGINPRRPAGLGQVRASANFMLFGLESGVNLLYSTNDNKLRQSMNQFHFHGTWRWITVSAGTVNPRFSKYSLNGVNVTGGMIDLNPGWFSLSLVGGRTQRAVSFSEEADFREVAFERWLYAARMGFGDRTGTSFGLTVVYASDDEGSVDDPETALPGENLSLTPGFNLSLFDDSFTVESNVTVSIFTRDKHSNSLGVEDDIPIDFLSENLVPRTSTRVDYAGNVVATMRLGPVRINAAWERVQPGFKSMGLGYVRSDQQLLRFRSQMPMLNNRMNVSLTFSSGGNNLMNTKLTTLKRQQIGTNIMYRFTQTISMTASYMRMSNLNEPVSERLHESPELHQEHLSQNFVFTPTLVFPGEHITHSISGTASYHTLSDKSLLVQEGERDGTGFSNITSGLNYGVSWPSNLSINISGNLLFNDSGVSKATGFSSNVSSGYGFLEGRLSVNVGIGFSRNGIEFTRIVDVEEQVRLYGLVKRGNGNRDNDFMEGEYVVEQWSNQYNVNASLSYRLPNGNPLRFRLRGVSSRPGDEGGREYDEFQASLQYTHRF